MMRLIVEDRIVEIPSLHARAQCGEGARTASGDFYFADDLNQPLLIESVLNFSWEKRPRTERITRVIDGLGLHPDMEQSLKTIGKYDAYGLRFDFDSAVLRPESVQLVREIAQMLQRQCRLEDTDRRAYGFNRRAGIQHWTVRQAGGGRAAGARGSRCRCRAPAF